MCMSVSRCQQQAVGSLAWLQGHWRAQGCWWLGEGLLASNRHHPGWPRKQRLVRASSCYGVSVVLRDGTHRCGGWCQTARCILAQRAEVLCLSTPCRFQLFLIQLRRLWRDFFCCQRHHHPCSACVARHQMLGRWPCWRTLREFHYQRAPNGAVSKRGFCRN